jgi:hypothetical protein
MPCGRAALGAGDCGCWPKHCSGAHCSRNILSTCMFAEPRCRIDGYMTVIYMTSLLAYNATWRAHSALWHEHKPASIGLGIASVADCNTRWNMCSNNKDVLRVVSAHGLQAAMPTRAPHTLLSCQVAAFIGNYLKQGYKGVGLMLQATYATRA